MKKSLISLLLLSAVTLSLTGCDGKSRSVNTWTDADGSANKPYLIYTAEDLNAVRGGVPGYDGWGLDKHYVLMRDIDLSGYAGYAYGKGWVPIGTSGAPFTGSLDGNGRVISRLTISSTVDYQGLFGYTGSAAVVKNIGLSSVNVKAFGLYVGGLAGQNDGTITNSYATGTVSGSIAGGLAGLSTGTISNSYATGAVSSNSYVGGLVGENDGTITDSYATGNVSGNSAVGGLVGDNHDSIGNSYATGSVSGSSWVGGLVGRNLASDNISNSYATGDVSGIAFVGGLVGDNGGTVSNSYVTGTVSGSSNVGGLFGGNLSNVTRCYWITDDAITPLFGGGGPGTGNAKLDDAHGKQQASFINWDFTTIWTIEEDVSYPELQWQM